MRSLLPMRSPVRRDQPKEPEVIQIEEEAADDVFSALSSETARRVLASLYDEPKTASEVADDVDTSVQNAKYHLEKLVETNLAEIVDTWYSDHGREMKVYDSTYHSLVVYISEKSSKEPIRHDLLQVVGSIGLLALIGIAIDVVFRTLTPQTFRSTGISAEIARNSGGLSALSPGMMFFVGGLFVIGLIAVRWYLRR